MTLSCSSTDFENDSDFRPSRARCCLRFRLCRSIRCVYRLLITCSFPFRRDSYSGQPSVIHITTSKGDSRLIRRPSVAIVRSPNTCATTVFRSLSYLFWREFIWKTLYFRWIPVFLIRLTGVCRRILNQDQTKRRASREERNIAKFAVIDLKLSSIQVDNS